jgi:hypothetical protein
VVVVVVQEQTAATLEAVAVARITKKLSHCQIWEQQKRSLLGLAVLAEELTEVAVPVEIQHLALMSQPLAAGAAATIVLESVVELLSAEILAEVAELRHHYGVVDRQLAKLERTVVLAAEAAVRMT